MNSSAQILGLYEEWKNLTEQEGAAILESDWDGVQRCQRSKERLQSSIVRVSQQPDGTRAESDPRVRERINELIALETRNRASLGERLELARNDRDNLDRTKTRLRQIHKKYVPAQGAVWNQYS